MPLAAPLILPFAELAGITIAGLGMAAASKKVSDFISDNPEISTQILTTLVPGGQGLNALFKKKASVTLEDVEDMTDEEAQDLSDEDIAGVMNEAGKTKGPGKRERMIEISRKLGLSGEGKERKKIIDDIDSRYDEGGVEDAPKPKFDYKKLIRNRNADGGAIGIEVLFEEKKDGGRIGFANGGIENIIGKNLDNVTNVAKGLDKEMLDMTYGDKYYRDVVNPAKLGQGPIPSKSQMMYQNLKVGGPFKAMRIGMDPYLPSFMGGGKYAAERAKPTAAASKFLNTLGKGAKFVGTKVGPLSFMDLFASTPLGADDEVTDEMRQSIEMSPTSTTGIMVDANDGFRTSPRTNIQGMDLEMDPGARINPNIQPSLNMFQRAGDVAQKGIGFLKDSPGMLLSAASGIPFAGSILSGLGNMFEYRGGMGYVDEDGVFRSADELDKLNARGGYYTDAARASRNRASRIQNMLARQAAGKRISEQNLLALQEQQAKEEAARQAAFDAIMSSQQSQQNFYDSLNEGRGATSTAESRSTAGDAPGYSGPSPFAKGGLATMFVEKR